MGLLNKEQFNEYLYKYYTEHFGEKETDIWYEQPAVNVWVFNRDGNFITLKSHIITGEVTEKIG